MLVYRVEGPDGYGPYWGNNKISQKIGMAVLHCANLEKWPTPEMDGIVCQSGINFCGFSSLKLLKSWFEGFLKELHDEGCRLVIYSIDSKFVKKGKKQLVFTRYEADSVKYESLLDLVKEPCFSDKYKAVA